MKECPIKYRQKYSSISTREANHKCMYLEFNKIKVIFNGV